MNSIENTDFKTMSGKPEDEHGMPISASATLGTPGACWIDPYRFFPRYYPPVTTVPLPPPVTLITWPQQSPPVTTAGVIQTLAQLVEQGKISETTFAKCVAALQRG